MKTINKYLLTGVLLFFAVNCFAQNKTGKILFLDFQFINGVPQLTGMIAVKGKLKTRKEDAANRPGISLQVLSASNKLLYKNIIDNPDDVFYEYPGQNNEIKRTELKRDTANITIRVPYSTDIYKIILQRISAGESLSKSSASAKYEFPINHSLIKQKE